MKKEYIAAASQSLKLYVDREINGSDLSQLLEQNFKSAENLDKKTKITLKYYKNFFEKEGKELYLDSNIYLKGEVKELSEFLTALAAK